MATQRQNEKLWKQSRNNKYRNIPHVIDGIRFASKKEAQRYSELKLLERAGKIEGLKIQHRYLIVVNGQEICIYVADFDYYNKEGFRVTEDVKGVRTPLYKLKAKLFKAIYNREIVEI